MLQSTAETARYYTGRRKESKLVRYPESSESFVFHRDLNRSYPIAERGEGVWLYTAAGDRYLDGSSGAAASNLGHGRLDVVDRMTSQLRQLEYVHASQFTTRVQEQLAERLIRFAGDPFQSVVFTSGGSEAIEAALKLARQHFVNLGEVGRHRVLFHRPSYHGATIGALGVSGIGYRRRPFEPLLNGDMVSVQLPDRYRRPADMDLDVWVKDCVTRVSDALSLNGPSTFMAVVTEVVVGSAASGVVLPPGYLEQVRQICDEHGILLIVDEVMSGMGRAGDTFAYVAEGVEPDLVTCGKGLSAGYAPLGAVLVSRDLVDSYRQRGGFTHGFTFSGHAVACAAGLAVIDALESESLVFRSAQVGNYLRQRLDALLECPIVGEVRGRGMMAGIELVSDRETKKPFRRSMKVAERLGRAAFENRLIVYPGSGGADGGPDGDHLLVTPPLVATVEEIDMIVDRLTGALMAVASEVAS